MKGHEKTRLCCDIDQYPPLHWATCECGFTTIKSDDVHMALAGLNHHREFVEAEHRAGAGEGRP